MDLHTLVKVRFCSDQHCFCDCKDCVVTELIEKLEPYVEKIIVKDNCL